MMGLLLMMVGCSAPERHLSRPNAVAISGDEIHVSDFHHQRIVTFNLDGSVLRTFGRQGLGRNQLWEVWGLLTDPDSGDLFVLNERPTSSTEETRVREIKTFRDGQEVSAVALSLADGTAPEWSEGISRDPAGRWTLSSVSQSTLVQFEADGSYRAALDAPEDGEPFKSPSALHQENSALWVIEQFEHRIRRLNTNSRQTLVFGEEGASPGQLRFPKALDLCPGGWVAVADLGNYRIQRYSLAGDYRDGFEPSPTSPDSPVQLVDVAVSPDCERLYLVDSKGDRVLVTDPEGAPLLELSSW